MKKISVIILFVASLFAFSYTLNAQSMLSDINKADEMYKDEQFAQSLFIYKNIDGADNRVTKRITEIEDKLKDVTFANDQFQKCIISGNTALKNQQYEVAYICFNAALLIKPDANFPKTKLRDISKYISDPNVDKRFNQLIATADKYFEQKDFENAAKSYKEALIIKPNDPHASKQLVDIDDIRLKRNAVKKEYDDDIYYADGFFKNSDYEQAKTYYQKALGLLPDESYPKQKLNEILSIQSNAAELAASYKNAVDSGNIAFNALSYDTAKMYFSKALTYKPDDEYPQTMIHKINDLQSKKNAKENEIASIRQNISDNISAEQYNTAQSFIQKGLSLKPNDSAFIAQKTQVDSIMAKRDMDETNYENFVSMGKESYAKKDYENASRYYDKALEIKSNEKIAALKNKADSMNNVFIAAKEKIKQKVNAKIQDIKEELKEDEQTSQNGASKQSQGTKKLSDNKLSGNKTGTENIKSKAEENKANKELAAAEEAKKQKAVENAVHDEVQNKLSNSEQSAAYTKQYGEAMLFYNKKLYNKALYGFKSAVVLVPNDPKSLQYIDSINNILSSHVTVELVKAPVAVAAGSKQSFNFNKLSPISKKNCYLKLVVKSTDDKSPKVYVNLFKVNEKKSGFILKDITANTEDNDIYVRLSDIMVWMREDINRIDIMSEAGSISVMKMDIIVIDK